MSDHMIKRGETKMIEIPQPLGLDGAVVFGLAFAASLHAMRSGEAGRNEYGRLSSEVMLCPITDAIRALRQWEYSKVNEPGREKP